MPIEFTVKVQKVGGSLQIVIPKPIVDGLKIKQGDELTIIPTDDHFTVKK